MDFTKQDIVLEDHRVLLRPLTIDDTDNLLPYALNEPHLFKYSLVSPEGSREALMNYISITEQQKQMGKEYAFIVFDKKANKYAGSTRFYDINPEFKSVQLGYTWYGTEFQRTGLNRHCKLLILEFAFEKWGLERVELRADANNAPSIQAMKDIGCTVEGILRSNMPTRDPNVRRSSIVLSILKDEWFSGVKDRLKKKIY
jgi:RimJ/RimL family protein N-acetyltransferase